MRAGSTANAMMTPAAWKLAALPALTAAIFGAGAGCRESSSPSAPQVQTETTAVEAQESRPPHVVAFRRADLSGTYLLTRTTSCPGVAASTTSDSVDLVQSGDFLQVFIPVEHSQISGTIRGNAIDFAWIESVLICNTPLLGTATIRGTSISGSVSGTEADGRCEC